MQPISDMVAAIEDAIKRVADLSVQRGDMRRELQAEVRRIIAARNQLSTAIDNIIVAVAPPMEGGETKYDFWGGPLTKMALKAALRRLHADLSDCTDRSELDGAVNAPSNLALFKQCMMDMPSWWHGRPGSDVTGLSERIQRRYQELTNA